MLTIENFEVVGWEHAIRGMRNPMNSWDRSDSEWFTDYFEDDLIDSTAVQYEETRAYLLGPSDQKLMMQLCNAGPVHAKFRRMIVVYTDIVAPLYWWKEFDTYKVGTVANSCSTMHKIHAKEFTLDDFSTDHMVVDAEDLLKKIIESLNAYRQSFLENNDKRWWWQMIQLLPSSYNQRRTVMLNYEVLANIYKYRKNHKLDEWNALRKWIEDLPYSEIITGAGRNNKIEF